MLCVQQVMSMDPFTPHPLCTTNIARIEGSGRVRRCRVIPLHTRPQRRVEGARMAVPPTPCL